MAKRLEPFLPVDAGLNVLSTLNDDWIRETPFQRAFVKRKLVGRRGCIERRKAELRNNIGQLERPRRRAKIGVFVRADREIHPTTEVQ